MNPPKIVLLKQLRSQYPIGIPQCSLFLEACQFDLPCTELKIKNYLIEQLILKTNVNVILATQLLEKQHFDIEKVWKDWQEKQSTTVEKILQKQSDSEDKIGLIFSAIEQTSTVTSQLLVDFHDFCNQVHYIEWEGFNALQCNVILILAKKMKLNCVKILTFRLKKTDKALWQAKWAKIQQPIYDSLIVFVQQNIKHFP